MAQATVSLKFKKDFVDVKLIASTSSALTSPIKSASYKTTNQLVKITLTGLAANTKYYYGVEIAGVLQTGGRGSFKTFPTGASSFTVAISSCTKPEGYNAAVFNTIKNLNPAMFIHMGDFFYKDIAVNDISKYRVAYDQVFAGASGASLYANIPTAYTWSDHDYGPSNSDGTSASRPAAQAAYKERVPHYPIPATNGAIYQSWVIGRVRFIMMDTRSQSTKVTAVDNSSKTTLGEAQYQWVCNELRRPEPLKVLISDKPFHGPAEANVDRWFGYSTERKRLANFIKDSDLEGHVILCAGDMHGIAIDNGVNADYADGGGANLPIFQAGPLWQGGSTKGGPYSEGKVIPGALGSGTEGNQYGLINITDTGGSTMTVDLVGKRGATTVLSWSMTVPTAAYVPPVGK